MSAKKSTMRLKKGKKLEPVKALTKVPLSDFHIIKTINTATP
jgi:hypothetical protein